MRLCSYIFRKPVFAIPPHWSSNSTGEQSWLYCLSSLVRGISMIVVKRESTNRLRVMRQRTKDRSNIR